MFYSTHDLLEMEVELIEDKVIEDQTIDIENIKEFKRDEEMEEIFKYTGKEGEKSNLYCFSLWAAHELIDKINELVLATKQNYKEIQSIKEKKDKWKN